MKLQVPKNLDSLVRWLESKHNDVSMLISHGRKSTQKLNKHKTMVNKIQVESVGFFYSNNCCFCARANGTPTWWAPTSYTHGGVGLIVGLVHGLSCG